MSICSPIFVCEEEKLIRNLEILDNIQKKTGAKILIALKGFAMYSTFDICKKYLSGCSASGLHEALLAKEEFNKEVHTYSPAFKEDEIDKIIEISDHIIFNSFSQLDKYKDRLKNNSIGIRINPEVSLVKIDLYNPCSPYSRLGITKDIFEKTKSNLDLIDGFHFHALCEQDSKDLKIVLDKFEENFKQYFKNLKWINFGGGHHITRKDYDKDYLIKILNDFKSRYPHIQIYLEPGEAIGLETGYLEATILDIVHNKIDIAILDTSAECHMPDTLAMPYTPKVYEASEDGKYKYQLTGNTCLAGDIIGTYSFDKKLKVGDKIRFCDMIHYTMVKTTTFNGINLPSIGIKRKNGQIDIIKTFGYNEYKSRI